MSKKKNLRSTRPLSAARAYVKRGIPVIIVKAKTKRPITAHGYQDATLDVAVLTEWFQQRKNANIGIVPGRARVAQKGLLVLDVDKKHGGFKTLTSLKKKLGSLPMTPTVKTGGGGKHYYFEHPNFNVSRDTAGKLLGPGIDVIGNGSFVVAPPSTHKSGERYVWMPGRGLGEI